MMKPITGQYECQHSSGVGLDYFTSRIDRLTLQANGHFVLIVQARSRIANAAQSLINGQQVSTTTPDTRREGRYIVQGSAISLHFDDGAQEQGNIAPNGEGIQIGASAFNKVSDSTLLPPTHRLQKDMDDIAKGLKIAGAIGGIAIKAAKTINETIQSTQGTGKGTAMPSAPQSGAAQQGPVQQSAYTQSQPAPTYPSAPAQPVQPSPSSVPPSPPYTASSAQQEVETLYCDQCGARARPGKRFCNNCGARLV
ncbi:MAG TPA: zinc ribbon domain-containing protein [Ktedonobacteraceae bacterium]|nr:zinc ribbon domain-containing protein [Ktedonobacteraceae bacterium]